MNLPDPQPTSVPPASRAPRILIADDDVRIVELLQFALTGNGFEVMVAYDGDEAWEILRAERPDLAILDVKMPRRTGFDLVEAIRAEDRLAALPVVLISGSTDTEMRLAGLMKGADDFLTKPFSPKELLLKCRRMLQRGEAARSMHVQRRRAELELERAREDVVRHHSRMRREQCVKEALLSLTRELNGSSSLDQLLHTFALTVMGQMGVDAVAVFLPQSSDPQFFAPRVARGIAPDRLKEVRLRVSGPLSATLLVESRPLRRKELEAWPDMRKECGLLNVLGTALIAPIQVNNSLLGMVSLGERADGAEFPREEIEMLLSLCSAAAVAVENARLFRDLEETTVNTIGALAAAMEAKDRYSRGHTERVAQYSVLLARALELPAAEVEAIQRGAMLHDIGKIGVLDVILNKPGHLNDEEMGVVQQHPLIGAEIVRSLTFLTTAQDIVRHHHERVDGRGYPDGIRGESFALGARIVAVADSFDAMTTDRPYRPAMTVEQTLTIMKDNSGTQYDTAVVEVLLKEIAAGRIRPPQPAVREAA